MQTDNDDNLERDPKYWIGQLTTASRDGSWFSSKRARNYDTRMSLWDGQSPDGKKWATNYGANVFPWEGASDARIRLADLVCNREMQLCLTSTFAARLQMMPVESTDAVSRTAAESVLKWMLFTHCSDSLRRELEIALNIRATYGIAIMGVFWRTTTRLEEKSVSLDDLIAMAQEQGDPNSPLAMLIGAILDPLQEENAIAMAEQFAPGTGTAANIRKLREGGTVEYTEPYIFESKPEWTALEPFNDVIFPTATYDLQRAPWIARREMITCEELEERVITEGYPEEFYEKAENYKGASLWPVYMQQNHNRHDNILFQDYRDLIEIWHVYSKETDEKTGATKVMCRVMHPNVDIFAKEEISPYTHGEYPFIELPRERVTRCLMESRGIPEIVSTMQAEIKTQRDYRTDRANIAILPPMRVPANRGKLDIVLGPAVQIPERRPNEFGWMQPPPFDQGTIEIERAVRRDVNEYFGMAGEGVDPNYVALVQQHTVDRWLRDFKSIIRQTYQLMQQYMQPVEILRVSGGQAVPFQADRESIQGQFDLIVDWDAKNLDSEALGVKLNYISQAIVPMDVAGVIDRAGLVKFIMAAVDPNLADLLVRDPGPAAAMEANDEQLAYTKIAAGTEPELPTEGQNHQLRAQVLQGIIQANPAVQQRYQQDEIFRNMIDARLKGFNFQVQQQQNAQIGRQGTLPALQQGAQP
jgi:hypothetical protein